MPMVVRIWLRRACLGLGGVTLAALWVATAWGRQTLTPPGWLAVVVTLLPYLYAGLLLVWCALAALFRTRLALAALAALAASAGALWGALLLPRRAELPGQAHALTVMVWNVQRMGEFSAPTASIDEQVACVSRLIAQEQPDLFALLEITYTQLQTLQQHLNISADHCLWSDYYGTGHTRYGGLATCIQPTGKQLAISLRRDLDLPPNWKYLFIEVQHTVGRATVPLNFLALHIAPPNVSERAVARAVGNVLRGRSSGLRQILALLRQYERQVKLQGAQAVMALDRISRFQDPTIMAGDFNSTQDAALHRQLRRSLVDTWLRAGQGWGVTRYWGDFLPLRIDYIYVTPEFAVHDAQTFAYACSDHFPVMSSVFLAPSAAPSAAPSTP
jgi:endonuclease/exonuclease/phosphatase (EEP) superfamily protein YafD